MRTSDNQKEANSFDLELAKLWREAMRLYTANGGDKLTAKRWGDIARGISYLRTPVRTMMSLEQRVATGNDDF